jgi:C4-dicarboxylate-specific signal transduction histidine kinase
MQPDAMPVHAAAAAQWAELSDAVLAGLVHMLNNRVTALSVCAELATMGDQEMITGGVLTNEVSRLQRASALIGLLPARPHQPEALELRPVLEDALSIHAHHPRTRLVACDVAVDGTMQPVRAPRWALLRLMLVVVDAAKEAAAGGDRGATIRLASDEQSASVRVNAPGLGPYGAAMAELCGGQLVRDADDLVLTFPSLLLLRQREREARAGE